MRRRDDAVVDRDALVHIRKVVFFQAQLAVLVQHEIDRLAIVLLHQLLEFHEGLGERMVIVELNGAVQRDRLLRSGIEREQKPCNGQATPESANKCVHCFLQRVVV